MKKNKRIIIIISIILISLLLITLEVANKQKISQNFSGKILQSNEIEEKLLSYKVLNNSDINNLKIVLTIQSEDGIEYIKTPTDNEIYGNGKNKIAVDYNCAINTEFKFKIKEINKAEVEETVTINELGTEEYPFLLETASELKNLANDFLEQKSNLNKSDIYYKLNSDLDLDGVEWTPIGESSSSTAFGGKFNGNNKTISNLNIQSTSGYQGLFGYLTGQVSNLNVENAKVSGTNYVGTIAGYTTGAITNCNVTNAEITGSGNYIGGLVGSTSAVLNNNQITGNVLGTGSYVGGLTGYTTNSASNNQFSGDITGSTNVGGICGYSYNRSYETNNITIQKCFASGNINGRENVGGIVGYIYIYCNIRNTYYYERQTIINSCSFDGNCSASTKCAGGIIGYGNIKAAIGTAAGSDHCYNSLIKITNSFCVGSINATNYAGGLLGICNMNISLPFGNYYAHNDIYIENSYVASELVGNYREAISNIIYEAGR